jgi:D-glycerate 3-kinase
VTSVPSDWRGEIVGVIETRLPADGPFVLGLCGPQGSGKSTAARVMRRMLVERGCSCAVLSIDDLYLTLAERQDLARHVHPLLATRGPPGTHDVGLGLKAFAALARPGEARLPRFDKGSDDRSPLAEWPFVRTPVDCLIFEGWCVGARPQPTERLAEPINALERDEDADGVWRRYVNDQLAGPYRRLFAPIDYLVQLRAPSFEQVLGWRAQQEAELKAAGGGPRVMDEAQLTRFIQHYERISRWIDGEMPERADAVIDLEADRGLRQFRLR